MPAWNRTHYAYELNASGKQISAAFGGGLDVSAFVPSVEVLPAQLAPVVRLTEDGKHELVWGQWGLAPYRSEASHIAARRLTARAETVGTTAHRAAFNQRRCLIPATGFREIADRRGQRFVTRLTLPSGKVMAIAGLWDIGHDRAGKRIDTYTIITSVAKPPRAELTRMPVIIARKDFQTWLEQPRIDLLAPYEGRLVIEQPATS